MGRLYVSEFTLFMERFLVEHPEVIADQRKGWAIFWNREVDPVALKEEAEDAVPFTADEFDPELRHAPPRSTIRH